MRWLKKDIKAMRGAIDSWLLVSRPAPHRGVMGQVGGFREAISRHLADPEKRKAIAMSEIRMLRNLVEERGKKNSDTARHFEANPSIYGDSTQMMVERFDKLAAENAKDVARADKLLARIEAEDLPPEVVGYDPFEEV